MKPIFKFFISLMFLLGLNVTSQAQGVVMKEFMSTDHTGKIEKSLNNGGKPLYWKLQYKETVGARIYYDLVFYKDAGMSTPYVSFPTLMRNLEWTYYIDVSMTKGDTTKVFAMIFKKDLRWSRVKYSPHEDCAWVNPPQWSRFDKVDNFQKLLDNTFMQMDKNVKLDCYKN